MSQKNISVLPLKDITVFPEMNVPIFVGRDSSMKSVELAKNNKIFIVTQKDPNKDDLTLSDLFSYGLIATIKQVVRLPDQTLKVLIACENIAQLIEFSESEELGWQGSIKVIKKLTLLEDINEKNALQKTLKGSFEKYSKVKKNFSIDFLNYLDGIEDSFKITYLIASRIDMKTESKQSILEIQDEKEILERIIFLIETEMRILEIERNVRQRVRLQVEQNQKDYYLNEQMKAIQKELGDADDLKLELSKLEERIKTVQLSDHARETALAELKKLRHMNQLSAEFSIIKNYLDFLLDLPWGIYTETNKDLKKIKEELDASHYGMEKAKERIYELIVQKKRVKDIKKSTILCFCGAPGIGKTTLAHIIGEVMGLKVVRIPLGGVKDESILRGHRRTYIGAIPGKILQALKDSNSSNIVIVLDEIGSMGQDWRGNPEDILLEILDTMQNKSFQDNYLGTGFDLSGVTFVGTTNSVAEMKPALLDRLEVIHLNGYTQEEKIKIARNYILPKLIKEYGLNSENIEISDENLNFIIRNYTYESGVRGLEQQLGKVVRKVMCLIEEKNVPFINLTHELIISFLKKPIYFEKNLHNTPKVGVVNGLAYSSRREGQEGEILQIESALVPGDGKLEFTGNLGNVMKESSQIAFKYLLANHEKYEIDLEIFKKNNIYINFPSGGTPKDGPSAGAAIFCSIFSTIKNFYFPENVAMTGEISLYKVLAVGGIKEKLLSAYRNGMKKVFLPYENEYDLDEISEEIKSKMEIILVKEVDDILLNLGLIAKKN